MTEDTAIRETGVSRVFVVKEQIMKAKVRFYLKPVEVEVEQDPRDVEDDDLVTGKEELRSWLSSNDSFFEEINDSWEIDEAKTEILKAEYDELPTEKEEAE